MSKEIVTLKKLRLCSKCANNVVFRNPDIVFIPDLNRNNCDYCSMFCSTSTALIARETPKKRGKNEKDL